MERASNTYSGRAGDPCRFPTPMHGRTHLRLPSRFVNHYLNSDAIYGLMMEMEPKQSNQRTKVMWRSSRSWSATKHSKRPHQLVCRV